MGKGAAGIKERTFTRYFYIGRCKSADVCIKNLYVSRLHTLVFFRNGKWRVQDLNSCNGTIVNGEKIQQYRQHQLGKHTQLRLSEVGPLLHLTIEKNDPEDRRADLRNINGVDTGSDPTITMGVYIAQFAKLIMKTYRKYGLVVVHAIIVGLFLAGYAFL